MDKNSDNDLMNVIARLDNRAQEIFRDIVETYLQTGHPVGSGSVSFSLPRSLSPASIRNVMAHLESLGLLSSPHKSAGRLPTQRGLRLFVDAFLEVGDLMEDDRLHIEQKIRGHNGDRPFETVLSDAISMVSGLSHCAGVVMTPNTDMRFKHIEFIRLEADCALAILVGVDGIVENRLMEVPQSLSSSALMEASNYLNERLRNRTISEAQDIIASEIAEHRDALDSAAVGIVKAGLAVWSGEESQERRLIVRGRAHLLEDVKTSEEFETIRQLFDDLESKKEILHTLDMVGKGDGMRIFIGSENNLFSLSGSSLIVAPYGDGEGKVIGALGVIGPTRLNYGRIIPMIDYTARLLGYVIGTGGWRN